MSNIFSEVCNELFQHRISLIFCSTWSSVKNASLFCEAPCYMSRGSAGNTGDRRGRGALARDWPSRGARSPNALGASEGKGSASRNAAHSHLTFPLPPLLSPCSAALVVGSRRMVQIPLNSLN